MNLEKITRLPHGGRELLGKWIRWTEKRDGSCLAVWYEKRKKFFFFKRLELVISSRKMKEAHKDIKNNFLSCDDKEHLAVLEFLKDNPNYIVFGELLQKGLSPTRIEKHDKNEFYVFDIWDGSRFLTYTQVYQHCFHYGMKCVRLFGESRHEGMESLFDFRDGMLKLCKEEKREGVVLKAFYPDGTPIYAKEKIDTPRPKKIKVEKGRPKYPILPDSEIYGAIDKCFVDLGSEKFRNKKIAMPLIAIYIREECKKHFCRPPKNLYNYYLLYLQEKNKFGG